MKDRRKLSFRDWIGILLVLMNIAFFVIVKFNDLKHLEKYSYRIGSKLEEMCERVARIEGKLE